MNLGNVAGQAASSAAKTGATTAAASSASSAATTAASNAAKTGATNATTTAVSGSSALKPDVASAPSSNIPQSPNNAGTKGNVVDFPGNNNPTVDQGQNADVIDFPGNEQQGQSPEPNQKQGNGQNNNNNNNNNSGNSNQQELQPGDKVEPGKKVNENGEIEDSAGKKFTKAAINAGAAYATGGESIGTADQVMNIKPVDKAIGVVGDTIDKTPGLKESAEFLDEAGVSDGINDAVDVVGKAKNGDIKGAVESAKNLKKDVDKLKKKVVKLVIQASLMIMAPIFFIAVIFICVLGPVLGGFLDIVEGVGDAVGGAVEIVGDAILGPPLGEGNVLDILEQIPDYDTLSADRQNILAASAVAVSAGVPYNLGGHPTASGYEGIPSTGLDCAGFVQWSLWTGLGENPGYLTTLEISNKIGSDFIEISEAELQPGDIGLKRRGGSSGDNYNHTGIYAGNGQWFHAAGSKSGVIRGNYSNFTIYLRYKGVS